MGAGSVSSAGSTSVDCCSLFFAVSSSFCFFRIAALDIPFGMTLFAGAGSGSGAGAGAGESCRRLKHYC